VRSSRAKAIASRLGWGAVTLWMFACTETLQVGHMSGPLDDAGGAAGTANGTMASGGMGGSTAQQCERGERLPFQRGQAMLLVLLQRSSSMLTPFDGETRLSAARGALLQATERLRTLVGLIDFPAINTECSARLVVPPGDVGREGTLRRAFRCELPSQINRCFETVDSIPTGDALDEAKDFFHSFAEFPIERRLLLIADGDPTCDATRTDVCSRAVSEASALLTLHSAKTQIVGVGSDSAGATCLGQIALAGGTATASGAGFPVARNAGELNAAIKKAIDEIEEETCTLKINVPFVDPASLDVTIEGRSVRHDPSGMQGWSVENDGRLRFVGDDCRRLRDARSQDVAVYRCGKKIDDQDSSRSVTPR